MGCEAAPLTDRDSVRSDEETAVVVFAKPEDKLRCALAKLFTVMLCVPALAVALAVMLKALDWLLREVKD